MTSTYSIKDLSQLSRIKAHTLRIWEQRYGIMQPERTSTNIRLYNQDDLKYLLNVAILYDHGYKISNIAKMDSQALGETVKNLKSHTLPYASQIQNLVIAMLELDENRFESQLKSDIQLLGLESTIENIIYPFLHQIGILWQTNTINPAQEHFISNLVRQKLMVAIDSLDIKPAADARKFILFLPQNELHEISLLYAHYLVKSSGHMSVYLGQNLPVADLTEVRKIYKADVLITVITANPCGDDVQPYLDHLGQHNPEVEIWLSGYQITSQALRLSPHMTRLENMEMLKNKLKG